MATFTLLILVRNQIPGLLRTLHALDHTQFDEILILDDASSDDITPYVEEVCKQIHLPVVKIFTSPQNIGTFENLKRGFWLATSDYVTLMAAEDILVPDFVQKLQSYIGCTGEKIVYVPSIQGIANGNVISTSTPQFSQNPLRDFLRLRIRNLSHGGGATYPRLKVVQSNLSQVSTFNLVEDWLIFYLLAESGFRFRTIKEVLYNHEVDLSDSATLARSERQQVFEREIREIILGRKIGVKLTLLVLLQKLYNRIQSFPAFFLGQSRIKKKGIDA